VLSTPPAFVLSQDQTLHKKLNGSLINCALYSLIKLQKVVALTGNGEEYTTPSNGMQAFFYFFIKKP
ncbi:hypothetical protein, partial [Aminobacterium mobile]|uniref:hypothetical protein n=1 Tax=Aminobacterium mobile TaxID=81467 RepID=UPI002FDFA11A